MTGIKNKIPAQHKGEYTLPVTPCAVNVEVTGIKTIKYPSHMRGIIVPPPVTFCAANVEVGGRGGGVKNNRIPAPDMRGIIEYPASFCAVNAEVTGI